MKATKSPFYSTQKFTAFAFLCTILIYLAWGCGVNSQADVIMISDSTITISPVVPKDILSAGRHADAATESEAAAFAWKEFIALNWPAKKGYRDSADFSKLFGEADTGTLVWHTFRNKVEIYPGNNRTPYGYDTLNPDFGYNAGPGYYYDSAFTGNSNGLVSPYAASSAVSPWVNLDESNEIGVNTMFAGNADSNAYPGQQILFLAKANKAEYKYIAKKGWYKGPTGLDTAAIRIARDSTVKYINKNGSTPPPTSVSLVSLPYGTIEVKTAWRRLNITERRSGRFFMQKVRYYRYNPVTNYPGYIDDTLGMIALHIIHKTPTAPYFTFATFEQADNILDTEGKPVEDENGNIINSKQRPPLNPDFAVTNATPTSYQTFSPTTANSKPKKSLYYKNTDSVTGNLNGQTFTIASGLPEGTVTINRRLHPIDPVIINANKKAHDSIIAYSVRHKIKNSPWLTYKLVSIQYKPLQKPVPGQNYTRSDSSAYYQANIVVESDIILQQFSGTFSFGKFNYAAPLTITDFPDTTATPVAFNAYHNGTKYLMGGCMGCHGNATNKGNDYSFILGNPVQAPEFAGTISGSNAARLRQLLKFLHGK